MSYAYTMLQVDDPDSSERMHDDWESNNCLSCYTLESAPVSTLQTTMSECQTEVVNTVAQFAEIIASDDEARGNGTQWLAWHEKVGLWLSGN